VWISVSRDQFDQNMQEKCILTEYAFCPHIVAAVGACFVGLNITPKLQTSLVIAASPLILKSRCLEVRRKIFLA